MEMSRDAGSIPAASTRPLSATERNMIKARWIKPVGLSYWGGAVLTQAREVTIAGGAKRKPRSARRKSG